MPAKYILLSIVIVALSAPIVAATSVNAFTENTAYCDNDACNVRVVNDVNSVDWDDCSGAFPGGITSCTVYQSCFARATASEGVLVRGEVDCLSTDETCSQIFSREVCTTDTIVDVGVGSYCLAFATCYTYRNWGGIELLDGECRIFWARATVERPLILANPPNLPHISIDSNPEATAIAPSIRVCVNNDGPFLA